MSDIQQISMPDDHHSDLQLSRMPWPPSSFDYTMTLLCSRPPMYVRSPLPSTICDSASPPGTLIVSCRLVPPQLQDRAPGGAIPLTLDLTLRVSAPLSKRFYLNTSQNNSSEYELDAETEDEAWAWVDSTSSSFSPSPLLVNSILIVIPRSVISHLLFVPVVIAPDNAAPKSKFVTVQ